MTAPARSTYLKTPIPVPAYFERWRKAFIEHSADEDPTGLLRGIFLGDNSSIPPDIRDLFRDAGLAHLLAASGFNCWIVAMALGLAAMFLIYVLAPLLPSALFLHARAVAIPLTQICGAWLFWLWTDQSPPITRAALMISLKFVLDLLALETRFGRLLLVLYAGSLVALPRLWHSASFQLTYGCLFGMVLIPKLVEHFRPRTPGVGLMLWNYFFTSAGACLGTIPTTWVVFGEVNFTSILTNWFAIPPVSFVIMPVGLLQMLLVAPGAPWAEVPGFEHATTALAWAGGKSATLLYHLLAGWMAAIPSLRWNGL